MYKLPHWVITERNAAFYDTESATAIEQTAKVYKAFQDMVDDYNHFVDEVNDELATAKELSDEEYAVFTTGIFQMIEDFKKKTEDRYQEQDARYERILDGLGLEDIKTKIYELRKEVVAQLTNDKATFECEFKEDYDKKKEELDDALENLNLVINTNLPKFDTTSVLNDFRSTLEADKAAYNAHVDSQINNFLTDVTTEFTDTVTNAKNEYASTHASAMGTYQSTASKFSVDVEEKYQEYAEAVDVLTNAVAGAAQVQIDKVNAAFTNLESNCKAATDELDGYYDGKLVDLDEAYNAKVAELGATTFTDAIKSELLNYFYPVSTLYETTDSTFKPSDVWGGTWELYGVGRVTVGADTSSIDPRYQASGYTAGKERVKLTREELPEHTHLIGRQDNEKYWKLVNTSIDSSKTGDNRFVLCSGGDSNPTFAKTGIVAGEHGTDHENMQPYITVFRWRRTA